MKKLLIFLLVVCLAFSVAGCERKTVIEPYLEGEKIITVDCSPTILLNAIWSNDLSYGSLPDVLKPNPLNGEMVPDVLKDSETGEYVDVNFNLLKANLLPHLLKGYIEQSSYTFDEYKFKFVAPQAWDDPTQFAYEFKKDGFDYIVAFTAGESDKKLEGLKHDESLTVDVNSQFMGKNGKLELFKTHDGIAYAKLNDEYVMYITKDGDYQLSEINFDGIEFVKYTEKA